MSDWLSASLEITQRLLMARNEFILESNLAGRTGIPTGPTRVALLDSPGLDRACVAAAMRQQGHAVLEFEHLKELVAALDLAQRFDLLLVAFEGHQDTVLAGARFLQRLIGKFPPMLLLLRPEQLERAENFSADEVTDFILLPCEACELVARVSNVLRTTRGAAHAPNHGLTFGRYEFEPKNRAVHFDGKRVYLQPREFDMALFLFRHAGHAQSRERIFKSVWGRELSHVPTRTLDVHAARLRSLLNLVPSSDATLLSVRGFGYRLFLET